MCFTTQDKNGPLAGNRTQDSVFAEPCDVCFTTRRKEGDQPDLHRCTRRHGAEGCCYLMVSIKWGWLPELHRPHPLYKSGASLSLPSQQRNPRTGTRTRISRL